MAIPLRANANQTDFFSDHLSHFSGARTNPYAIQVAGAICKDFKLSVAGQRRLNKALNDLPCIDALDSRLSFAWSMEHIIRSPRVHQFGYEHLTIVITLAECFHEAYAAEVFHQLAKKALPPGQSTPHIYQWLDLIHFCNGILAIDEFSSIVESFILLDPYSVTPGGKYSSDRCLTPTQSIADALLALSELTCGKRDNLTLRGGGVIGWLGALAEQFFGLSVTIESKEHVHLHGPLRDAQLSLIYTEKPELIIEDGTMESLTKEMSVISLSPYSRQVHFLPFGGRVQWSALLQQVFGQSFHDLEVHSKSMYAAIGSAFRAIEGAKDSSSINPKQSPHVTLSAMPEEPSAQSLIERLTAYVSSLQRGAAKMERPLRLTPQEAAKMHFEEIKYLVSKCKCGFCHKISDDPAAANSAVPISTGSTVGKIGYCLPSIVETIVMIGLMLSRVVTDRQLNPSREGIQLLYKLRADKFARTPDHDIDIPKPNTVSALYDDLLHAPTSYVLRMACKFFAGGHMPPLGDHLLPTETVALAHEGICAFASELVGGRNVRKDMKGMVRVVNGGFSIGQKTYRIAAWSPRRPIGREGWQWEDVDLEHLPSNGSGSKLWVK